MKTTDPSFLLPRELTDAIRQPESSEDDPEILRSAVREHWLLRHTDLAETDPFRYRIPITTALFLYRRSPQEHRSLVLSALGSPQAPHFCSLLAAGAREAYESQDWTLLGKLAWQLESNVAPCTQGTWNELSDDCDGTVEFGRRWQLASGKVQAAFMRLLDYSAGRLTAPEYVTLGLSYFSAIPDNFVFPVDWSLPSVSGEAAVDGNHWAVLRLLCRKNGAAWQTVPDALERARQLQNPFLQSAVGLLARQKTPPPPAHSPISNPFRKLAGAVGEEPAKGAVGRFVRKVTGRSKRAEPTVDETGAPALEIDERE